MAKYLFRVREAKPLDVQKKELFHSQVAKLLYLSKQIRPEFFVAVCFLARKRKRTHERRLDEAEACRISRRHRRQGLGRTPGLRLELFIGVAFALW